MQRLEGEHHGPQNPGCGRGIAPSPEDLSEGAPVVGILDPEDDLFLIGGIVHRHDVEHRTDTRVSEGGQAVPDPQYRGSD